MKTRFPYVKHGPNVEMKIFKIPSDTKKWQSDVARLPL